MPAQGVTPRVQELIAAGLKNKDIIAQTGCSSSYVSMVRTGKRPRTDAEREKKREWRKMRRVRAERRAARQAAKKAVV